MNRIMIAGTGSGCGKTTMTCAILAAFQDMEKNVIAFKCGPDYIDPMFHRKVTQTDSRNLDLFLMGEDQVRRSLHRNMEGKDIAVIEGVMGFYDGIGSGDEASAHHLSQVTATPVILVVGVKGKANSICAEIRGYAEYETNNICAVLLNHVSAASYVFYKTMIEEKTGIKVVGFLPPIPEATINSRHLGLITADEIQDIRHKINLLGQAARQHIDLNWIWQQACRAETLPCPQDEPGQDGLLGRPGSSEDTQKSPGPHVRIYAARDEAFCFFYEDNHKILETFGAEVCFFSPLHDKDLPDDAGGILLWGGYPELYAEALEKNESMKRCLRQRIKSGLPVYAECGGFIYLQERLTCQNGESYELLGVLQGKAKMTDRLQNFGYVKLTAKTDNLLCEQGGTINAHSFHYAKSDEEGDGCIACKQSNHSTYPCIVTKDTIWAGYPHLHFSNNPDFAERFVKRCYKYRKNIERG